MKIYTSVFLTIMLFFSLSVPVASEQTPISKDIPLQEQIDTLRYHNLVTLRLINFKAKYGTYENYYKQTDTAVSEK